MPPVDSTPDIKPGNFELMYSSKAYNRIPVHEYRSKETGLTLVIAEVEGPVVNGFFCLVTEAFDDDGLPHTLEHLIFLGSETYPYKGVLDLLANRCLASGTNAWTDIDHTCYTMETAGSEGFLSLMPIFLDHILYPILSDEGFITEVHHITSEGEDAGVVYCEMQGRENSAESRLHLTMARKMYPGHCGYSSETGGIMKNLRETCNNTKVKTYHKEFYRPENLKIIITGQVKPEDVFKALEPLEMKIRSKGDRGPFTRPWQNPCPPVESSENVIIKYPSDDEKNGIFSAAWRGPSAVNDQYTLMSCSILLKYLTAFAVSPLQREFVEVNDPYASKVVYSLSENSESCLYFIFENVPKAKLCLIKPKLDEILANIVENEDIDMERMKNIINRAKLESLSNMENNPHQAIAFMIVGHMLYGNTKEDLEQRINPLVDLDKT
ncbi:Peptidase [Oryctes borbonicus]|uniref:Peptidase n=1 Tax=Oryctes borbonicus TaxID=1629725 RepID=A0A0T6AZ60_9SCAR|nr:Peptidase [Oryctes borbonicus]